MIPDYANAKQTTSPTAHSLIEKRERERITTIGLSLSTNKALVKSFVESVFNDHDLPAIEKYLAATIRGKEEFKQSLTAQFKAFPDIHTK
jgi:hypothetical protein